MAERRSASKNLTEPDRLAKNARIREAGIATRARRSLMDCRVRDLKIVTNRLNRTQKTALRAVFLESKWIRNSALTSERFDLAYPKELAGSVPVRLPDGTLEKRPIIWLGSQMQQSAVAQLGRDLKSLTALKKAGRPVGRLRYAREVNSIDLQQYGVTYRVDWDRERVKIQNIPGWLPVRGLRQFRADSLELANAKLVQRADGWHLLATSYAPRAEFALPTLEVGIDFGVRTSFALSDGSKVTAMIEEGERLRRLQRKLSRQVKGSNGHRKTLGLIQREYQRLVNRKDELANQFVHSWTVESTVYFQDELISSWKRRDSGSRGSKRVHAGILGRVKARLRRAEHAVMLPSWVATTQWCAECGELSKHGLSERVFSCNACGATEDRDTHAAQNMVVLGKKYQSLTSGTEGSAGGGIVRLKQELYRVPAEQAPAKPETAMSLASP